MKRISFERELKFLISVLSQFKVPVNIIKEDTYILSNLDLGLRKLLKPDFDRKEDIALLFSLIKDKAIYKAKDEIFCSYIFLRLPDKTILSVGPYTLSEVTHSKLLKYASEKIISEKWLPFLEKYFSSVPYIAAEKNILACILAFADFLWDDEFTVKALEDKTLKKFSPLFAPAPSKSPLRTTAEKNFDISILEKRYESENVLMQEISKGRTHVVESMLSNINKSMLEERVAEPIRNAKNYLVILNTLMRKATENAHVHPVHIDRASSVFAKKIEQLVKWDDVPELCREMAFCYCQLVNEHSLKGYSPTVQKVIAYIDFDITADLSLCAIADKLNINASYLSTLFRKETGVTLTDFVAKKRVEHAIFLLKNTELNISTVCYLCGISDNNYFTKIFKKQTGKTPIQYRKDNR